VTDLAALERRTRDIYERNAAAFDRQRPKTLIERPWLERLARELPAGARVLDLGCGAGEPIAAYFIARGWVVTGADFAPAMLDLAASRFPNSNWHCSDMRELDLGETFAAIVGWDSFFHLPPADQPATLAKLADHLVPGGWLLLTVGPHAGEVIGRVNGEAVYHASLSPEAYEQILHRHGLAISAFVPEDPDCDCHTVLLAQNAPS